MGFAEPLNIDFFSKQKYEYIVFWMITNFEGKIIPNAYATSEVIVEMH